MEEALDPEVGHCETQDGEFVQLGDDIWGERQQAGQAVQLGIQPVPVPLGRVGLLVGRGRFPGEEMDSGGGQMSLDASVCVCFCVCSSLCYILCTKICNLPAK